MWNLYLGLDTYTSSCSHCGLSKIKGWFLLPSFHPPCSCNEVPLTANWSIVTLTLPHIKDGQPTWTIYTIPQHFKREDTSKLVCSHRNMIMSSHPRSPCTHCHTVYIVFQNSIDTTQRRHNDYSGTVSVQSIPNTPAMLEMLLEWYWPFVWPQGSQLNLIASVYGSHCVNKDNQSVNTVYKHCASSEYSVEFAWNSHKSGLFTITNDYEE